MRLNNKRKEPRFWDTKQITFFLNATKSDPMNDLWRVTLNTGMRAGEIAGLKWDCIHLDKLFGDSKGYIEIKRTYNQKTRRMQETTKNGERRVIPILPDIRDLFYKLFENQKGPFVFGGETCLESSHFNRQLQSALNKLNTDQLPRITFHGLRHSFCSYLDATGMNRRVVAEIMGHRDLNTINRYSHVNNQMLGFEVARWVQNQSQQKTNKLELVSI